jgi:exodeoxyribonuclease V alpha subunit
MIPEECHELFRPVDLHFARAMERFAGGEDKLLFAASLLVSYRAGMGDACLDIHRAGGGGLACLVEGYEGKLTLPAGKRWVKALASSPVVGKPGDYRPLVLDETGRLYLYRFWRYERVISETLASMAGAAPDRAARELLAGDLERYFPLGGDINWQRVAALAAATRRLCVVSGGPGTGKTTAVVRILAILIRQGIARGAAPTIAMAAPTGKASKRLQEAVTSAMEVLSLDGEVRERMPREVFTLHRLLGIYPGSSRPGRGPGNPLPHDIVVVDEGSMADMALMSRLLLSLRPGARLILLGDRDQLASVEAGAVLGDLCDTGKEHGRSRAFAALAKELAGETLPAGTGEPPLADSLVILRKSYRFGPESGIGALAAAIRDGDAAAAMRVLASGDYPDVRLRPAADLAGIIDEHAVALHSRLAAASPEEAFGMLGERVLLCALRQGRWGVEQVNRMAERALYRGGLIRGDTPWYAGRPVMVTRNDYSQKLFNGDAGVVLADPESGENRVFFPAMDAPYKKIIPSRLPPHESACAVTVHKSQGSEYHGVTVVLPDRHSPVLTRELLYTAVTRARESVEIVAPGEVVERCIAARIERASGLRDALWG